MAAKAESHRATQGPHRPTPRRPEAVRAPTRKHGCESRKPPSHAQSRPWSKWPPNMALRNALGGFTLSRFWLKWPPNTMLRKALRQIHGVQIPVETAAEPDALQSTRHITLPRLMLKRPPNMMHCPGSGQELGQARGTARPWAESHHPDSGGNGRRA